jgi:hypothetical protein
VAALYAGAVPLLGLASSARAVTHDNRDASYAAYRAVIRATAACLFQP